jgi:hypothetical protein
VPLTTPEAGVLSPNAAFDRLAYTNNSSVRKELAFTDDIPGTLYSVNGTIPDGRVATVETEGTFTLRNLDGFIKIGDDQGNSSGSAITIDNDSEDVIVNAYSHRLQGPTHDPALLGILEAGVRVLKLGDHEDVGNSTTIQLYDDTEIIRLRADSAISMKGTSYDYMFPKANPGVNQVLGEGATDDNQLEWVDLPNVGENLSLDDVPVWDGSEFQPSGIQIVPGFNSITFQDVFFINLLGNDLTIGEFEASAIYTGANVTVIGANASATEDTDDTQIFVDPGNAYISIGIRDDAHIRVDNDGAFLSLSAEDVTLPKILEATGDSRKMLVMEDSMIRYKEVILDKKYATFYEKELREYTLGTSPAADTVITIDTIGVAFAADSISISDGLITNERSTTVVWQVDYDFTYTSDEDACRPFFDLTTDGSEVPTPIAGSEAYGELASPLGSQMPGRTFLVSVPSGQAIRLCVKGNTLAATEMNISYLTITIDEK